MCFGCSKEPSHRDSSFEYPQHMFWLRNKKNNLLLHTLIWGPAMTNLCWPLPTPNPTKKLRVRINMFRMLFNAASVSDGK